MRSVSLARAYQDIGFDKQALRESSISINADPGNSSAHRFLADSYLTLPRHEIARRSELLQSQLTQPLNKNPIQPQLTDDNFFVLRAAGPTGVGLNEYTPMYTQRGLTVQADVVAGNMGTWGDQVIVSGLQGRTAFAISQLAYSTDGTRENEDFEKRLYGAFVQYQLSEDLGLQAEIRHSSSEFGDLLQAFDPEIVTDDRHDLRDQRFRFGMRKDFAPGSHLAVSLAVTDQRELVESFGELAIEQDTRTYVAEAQHVFVRDRFNLVTGLGFDTETQPAAFFGEPMEFRPYAANAYAYLNATPTKHPISAHLGLSIDYLLGPSNQPNPGQGRIQRSALLGHPGMAEPCGLRRLRRSPGNLLSWRRLSRPRLPASTSFMTTSPRPARGGLPLPLISHCPRCFSSVRNGWTGPYGSARPERRAI